MTSDKERREVAKRLRSKKPAEFGEPLVRSVFRHVFRSLYPKQIYPVSNWVLRMPYVLADLIAPRGKDALAAEVNEKVERLTRERDEAVAEAAELRGRAERAEAEADGLRRRLAKVGFLLRDDGEGGR